MPTSWSLLFFHQNCFHFYFSLHILTMFIILFIAFNLFMEPLLYVTNICLKEV